MSNNTPKDCAALEKQLQDVNLKRSWYEQAYLISYLQDVVKPLKQKQNPSKFIKLIKTKDSSDALVNNLTTSPDIMTFLDAYPIDYGQLVPHIEIYKVYIKDRKRKSMTEELFPFEAHTNFTRDWTPEKMLNTLFRGSDAGIQSIDVKMEGKGRNPATANILDIKIQFQFNDVKVLFKKWKTKSGFEVSYSDLIRFPPSLAKADPRAKFASFRIKLVLGWSLNKNNPILQGNNRDDFIRAAEQSKVIIVADLYAHTMEFKEDGSLSLTANYKGAIEQTFANPAADLLNNIPIGDHINLASLKSELTNLELSFWESASRSGADSKHQDRIKALLKLREKIIELKEKAKKINDASDAIKNDKNKTYITAKEGAIKDYKAISKAISVTISGQTKADALMNAAKKTPEDMQKAYKKSQEQVEKELEKIAPGASQGSQKKYKKALEKATKTLRNSIQALESNIRGQHLFTFVQEMMNNNKVAWISTELNSAFVSYVEYRRMLEGDATQSEIDEQNAATKNKLNQEGAKTLGGVDKTKATADMKKMLHPEKESGSVTHPDGTKKSLPIYKKIGTPSKLYLSDEYTKGQKLFFFTLGDLISTILDTKGFGEGMEQLSPGYRILFGTMDYEPVNSDQIYNNNLYDLPISLNLFISFLAKKIVGTGRKVYLFLSFIHDLVKFIMDKIVAGLGVASAGAAKVAPKKSKTFKLDMTPIDLHVNLLKSTMQNGRHTNAVIYVDEIGKKYAFGKKVAINKISNTLFLHAHSADPFRTRIKKTQTADFFFDRGHGIQHFIVGGPNRGVMKTIKFEEYNNALFNVAMYRNAQGGGISSGQGVIKPSKFGCTLTLVGNPYFFIGQLFYVNTQLISDKNFLKENIMNGGYYMVISVDSHFSVEKGWETTIKGILTIADIVIYKGEKSNPVTLITPERHADLESVIKGAESAAANNALIPQPLPTK